MILGSGQYLGTGGLPPFPSGSSRLVTAHTGMVEIDSRRGEAVEEHKDDKDDGARLDVAGALRLRGPGGLHFDEEAPAAVGFVAIGLLVRVVGDVLRRQRDRRASHRGGFAAPEKEEEGAKAARKRRGLRGQVVHVCVRMPRGESAVRLRKEGGTKTRRV